MARDWRENLKAAMAEKGIGAKPLSLRAGLSESYVRDVLAGSDPSVTKLSAVCRVLGKSLGEIYYGTLDDAPTIRRIGQTLGDGMWADAYEPSSTFNLNILFEELIAIDVVTDSYAPRYERGDVLMGPRLSGKSLLAAIGAECILRTTDGEQLILWVHAGSRRGVYDLRAHGPVADRRDRRLAWAAPIRIILRGGVR